jgi:lysophospholipase
MQLVALARNPVPSGAVVGAFKGYDGVALRFARWEATRGPRRGTVCCFPGRTEFIERYVEVVADLRRRGFAVAIMDWRGQGGSQRLLSNPRKGHVWDFSEYDRDLACFMRDVVLPDCPPPFYALAHSMGGNILLRNSIVPASWFRRMILSAPMLAIHPSKEAVPHTVARAYAEAAVLLGLGRTYVPGGTDRPSDLGEFEGNPLTSDQERYQRNKALAETAPQLLLGSPTCAWLRAAYRSMAELTDPAFAVQVRVPTLIFVAGQDVVVQPRAIEDFTMRLKLGTHVLLPMSRHEILQESDDVRTRFWAAFDAYLGVEAEAA